MSDLVFTPAELADQLGICLQTVRRLTDEGRVPHVRLSAQRVVYPKRQIEQWLDDEAHASTILFELEADGADVPGFSGRGAA